eukprot:gene19354-23141_t
MPNGRSGFSRGCHVIKKIRVLTPTRVTSCNLRIVGARGADVAGRRCSPRSVDGFGITGEGCAPELLRWHCPDRAEPTSGAEPEEATSPTVLNELEEHDLSDKSMEKLLADELVDQALEDEAKEEHALNLWMERELALLDENRGASPEPEEESGTGGALVVCPQGGMDALSRPREEMLVKLFPGTSRLLVWLLHQAADDCLMLEARPFEGGASGDGCVVIFGSASFIRELDTCFKDTLYAEYSPTISHGPVWVTAVTDPVAPASGSEHASAPAPAERQKLGAVRLRFMGAQWTTLSKDGMPLAGAQAPSSVAKGLMSAALK